MKRMTSDEMISVDGGKWSWSCTWKATAFGVGIFIAGGSIAGIGAVALGMSAAWVVLYDSGCFDPD